MSQRFLPPRLRALRVVRRRNESGAAAVEFAIVAIPFFLLLYGLIVFGMALAVKQSVTNAAAEGARSAVGISDPAVAIAQAQATVNNRLDWLGNNYQPGDVTISWFTPGSGCGASSPPAGSPMTICVAIDLPYKAREVVPAAPIIQNVTPENLRSLAVVQIY
ncbi:MAG: TadE/TadG family type IV pilus assembly protein [Actinomycetota bacterium]